MYVVGALLIAWGISGFFTTVFQCTPVHYLWDRDVITGHCVAMQPSLLGLAAINTILNFAVLVLPIPMIWQLQMRTRQKVAVAGILVLGSLSVTPHAPEPDPNVHTEWLTMRTVISYRASSGLT